LKTVGFIRAKRKKEIDEFRHTLGGVNPIVETSDYFCEKERIEFNQVLDRIKINETLVIISFENAVDTVFELRHLLYTIADKGANLKVLDKPKFNLNEGIEIVTLIDAFIRTKEGTKRRIASKIGRPYRKYPEKFYYVYQKYRSKEIKTDEAAAQLGLNRPKFYELIRLFEN